MAPFGRVAGEALARPELVVSDFAGTVMQDDGAVLNAYRYALDKHGIAYTDAELAARRGANKSAVFSDLAARSHAADAAPGIARLALDDFEARLVEEYSGGPVAEVPGAERAIRTLQGAGIKVGLTSGFDRDLVDLLLRRLRWEALFDTSVAADEVRAGRPAPFLIFRCMTDLDVRAVNRVAVVGDTPLDLEAGSNAGARWVIGVLSGAHGLSTLGPTRHTHLLESVAALPGVWQLSGAARPAPAAAARRRP
jgi:phosphonatase-like hydrolase